MNAINELRPLLGIHGACDQIGVTRSNYYRWKSPPKKKAVAKKRAPNFALSTQEQQEVLDLLHSPEFVDMAPYEVYATLLDRSRYLCSIKD